MNKFEITLEQAQELAKYLQQKPYVEVANLIEILRALKPIEEKPKQELREAK